MSLSALNYLPLKKVTQIDQLDAFGDLLHTQAMPLGYIGDCSRAEITLRHILDSILPAIAPESAQAFPLWREQPLKVFDLGAGAGLPSVPLAILFPQHTFYLIDSQEKRCTFVSQAAETLGLKNIRITHSVVQNYQESAKADVVIFRAFRKVLASLELALHVLSPSPDAKVLYWRSQPVSFSELGTKRMNDLGYKIDAFVKFESAAEIIPRGLYTFAHTGAPKKEFPRSWKKISADTLIEVES